MKIRAGLSGGARVVSEASEIGRTKSDDAGATAQSIGSGDLEANNTYVHRLYYKFDNPLKAIMGILADITGSSPVVDLVAANQAYSIIAKAITSALDLSTLTWANQGDLTIEDVFSDGKSVWGSSFSAPTPPSDITMNQAWRWGLGSETAFWPFVENDPEKLLYGVVMQYEDESIVAGESFAFPIFPKLIALPLPE